MENFEKVESCRNDSQQTRRLGNDQSQLSGPYMRGMNSSSYTAKSSFTSAINTSDLSNSEPSSRILDGSSRRNQKYTNRSIRLMPVKVSDMMEMFSSNPAYRDKSPVMINVKENDIDQIIERQQNRNFSKMSASQKSPLRQSMLEVPMSMTVKQSENDEFRPPKGSIHQETSPLSLKSFYDEEQMFQSFKPSSRQGPEPTKPPLGDALTPQVYAMVGTGGSRSPKRRRRKTPKRGGSPARKVIREKRSRSRRRPRSRIRSRSRRRVKPRRVVQSRSRSPVMVMRRNRRPLFTGCCNPYPMCDKDCTTVIQTPRCPPLGRQLVYSPSRPAIRNPTYTLSRPMIAQSRMSIACNCNLCEEKLQFIQPGVCSKRKHMWTNEYAIIPKKQINLIDPCEELDPTIYPRADNPCIRDGHGNPLTDCIGRPLRDPIGKKFLSFTANGSVVDTSIRGNFYTGQPPLCVKCPLPTNSCAPDATHNWWMSCGHPIMANMNSYYQSVLASDRLVQRT